MPSLPTPRPSVRHELIRESEELEERMARLQVEEPVPTEAEIAKVRAAYRDWHARARRVLPPETAKKFDDHKNGSMWKTGIGAFLSEPRRESVLQAEDGSFPVGRWQYSFNVVRDRMEQQRSLILDAEPAESPAELAAADLAAVLRRLPELLRVLQKRRPDWPIAEAITDERELQVVVEALLRTLFDDVRPEDYVPSHAGANSRVDFVLPEVGIVVETKMIRASLSAQKLGEELLVDMGRYPGHPDCKAIVAYVYDPERRLANPRGIERDLTRTDGSGPSICVIS